MSATDYFEDALLELIFNNTDLTGVADGIATAGDFYVSLHSADPGEGGNQASSEVAYTDYARVAVERTTSGWTVLNSEVTNAGVISFPIATGGSATATHFGIGLSSSGAGTLLYHGALTGSLNISAGIRPIFDVSDLKIELD